MPVIHCHECKVLFDIIQGSAGERGFIVTNLVNSEPDLTKIFFCTLDCYTEHVVKSEFRPTKIPVRTRTGGGTEEYPLFRTRYRAPDEHEEKEQYKEFYNTRRAELVRTPGVQKYMKHNDFVDRVAPEECERLQEMPKQPISEVDDDFAWADAS